ncbi:MAG TPA: HAD family hydrolase [Desulfobacteraceae bacterium]|nr:HAD family hydrolase [Desulfobacteraceae bacterium]
MGGIRAVLFDLDGTLTRPGALDFPAIKRTLGCPQDSAILEFLAGVEARERSRLEKILESIELEAAELAEPNEGAEACVRALRSLSVPLGIITRNCHRSVDVTISRLGNISQDDFSVIVCREDAPPKPDPAGVLLSARLMGIDASNLLLVGDFRFDVLAGRAAGALTALVTNGGECPWKNDPPPDWLVNGLKDVVHLVKNNSKI